ncbi:dTDP-4-dehydrorhamnose 3,5-epimerase [Aquicella lusitana]|uniref:dTDP-4-dehydrorhamnose 3,5-epimerase n=1 Tax=Aquicella lusitana TaxID=254246 RepID=A0A370GM37_9COXI|nr:dTDP-4-dehydrorhamnose 3,5-epimerase [Aquicella lusitana]RDI44795.1 dTDP-4-dehydrorhamnose 3,5-epimerase [Aquicella lusitana]VVC72992.1 dTDP-4-dehydrorhamnose 3,5-epimerase [Aquicella lusitana]
MHTTNGPLSGLLIIEPRVFKDSRGYFFETHQQTRYGSLRIPHFVQDNVSRSHRNVLRGLHYQLPHAQGKLVWVTRGSVWDVVVDIRKSSPTFGQWFGITLSDENHIQMYIPPGFAHGFCVLSEEADFHYKCTDYYAPSYEHGIAWNDARLNIAWPVSSPVLSPKDEIYPALHEIAHENLFT